MRAQRVALALRLRPDTLSRRGMMHNPTTSQIIIVGGVPLRTSFRRLPY